MREFVREGVRLAHLEDGTGEPALIFVHGWCCDHTYFAPQHEYFRSSHRVVSIDQRGFGASDRPEQIYSIEGWADDIVWIAEQLEIERAVVIGHSMAGAIALAAAANHAERICGAVLCDPAVVPSSATRERWQSVVEALGKPDYREFARDFISKSFFLRTLPWS